MKKSVMRKLLVFALLALMAATFTGCAKRDDGALVVLNYGKYIEPEVLKAFQKETGIKVKYEEYESVEDMYAKYSAGSIDYDLICTSDYMIQTLNREGQLIPIDFNSLSNMDNMDQRIVEQSAVFDPTHEYSLPYFYGTVGIMYNTEKVDEEVNSWDILWDEKYKNDIIMINSQRDAFLTATMKLGYDINTTDREQLDKTLELMKSQKDVTYAYLLDETNEAMIAEDAALAVCYSGEAATAMDYNENLDYAVPEEGSNLWIDSWVVPRTCKHYDEAMIFLDYLMEADNAIDNFNYVWYASPCLSVWEDADEEDLEDVTIFPTEEILERCSVYEAYDDDTLDYTTNLWKQLKSH